MKAKITSVLLLLIAFTYAQVGIGTTTPASTLDVIGAPANTTTVDGLLIPRLTGDELRAKNAVYLAAQNGAMVYVTAEDTAPVGKTVNVVRVGLYTYNAVAGEWQTPTPNNIYTGDGTLAGNRTVAQGVNSINFVGPGNKLFSGTGNVGINQLSPTYKLEVVGSVGYGLNNTRTETRDDAGIWGPGVQSGFYQTNAPVNYPTGATSWWHMIEMRHDNVTNNNALQIAGSHYDQDLWFRKTNNSGTTPWSKVLTTTSGWSTTGNTGTTAASNFIGTTDNIDFVTRTNNTERMRVTGTGNVGIGTASPTVKLDVIGTTKSNSYVFPAPAGDPSPVITARTVPTGQGAANEKTELILFHGNDWANSYGPDQITLRAPFLSFQTYNDTTVSDINNNAGFNERMVVTSTGNVGIGTTGPNNKLEVTQGTAGNSGIRMTNLPNVGALGTNVSGDIIAATAATTPNIYSVDGTLAANRTVTQGTNSINFSGAGNKLFTGGGVIIDAGGQNTGTSANALIFGSAGSGEAIGSKRTTGGNNIGLDFYTGYINRLSITNFGNVGIGTTAPANKLEVTQGTAGNSGIRMTNFPSVGALATNANGDIITATAATAPNIYTADGTLAGNRIVMQGSNSLQFTGTGNTILNSGNVGIGTTTPTQRLEVIGQIKGDRFLGYGAGGINTNSAVGFNSLFSNTSGIQNTATGGESLSQNSTGSFNTATGYHALRLNTTGERNQAYGLYSMSVNTTGSANNAFGNFALSGNVSGSGNTAFGNNSLRNTTTSGNASFGEGTLQENHTGSNNTAVGAAAMGQNLGGAGDYGSNNTVVGNNSGYNLNGVSVANNTIIGGNSGLGIITGANNTILGANVSVVTAGLSNNIIIADGSGNRRINVDDTGNVGIGTNAPNAKLQVDGTFALTTATSGTANSVVLQNAGTFTPPAASGNAGVMYIIRNTSTTTNLSVATTIPFNSATTGTIAVTPVQGAITIVSNGTNWFRIQ